MTGARFDAIVIGAGPAGASTAILLARAGWQVALIEKQRFPRRKVCGECIAASNLPLLDALGIGAAVARLAGADLKRVALMRGLDTIVAPLPRAEGPGHPFGRALGREELDTLLVMQARAAGATVLQPASLQSISGGPGDFRCVVRLLDPEGTPHDERAATRELAAPLVVAAHGSWEPLPFERAQRREARRPSDLFAFKANFSGTRLAPDLLPVLAFDGGYGGMVVADAGLATLACCVREDRLDALRAAQPGLRAGEAIEATLMRECRGVADALSGATRQGAWLASGPLRPGVRVQREGRGVFLVGNAAGEAHPIVGEGMSMALQSAWLLAALVGPERSAIVDGNRSADVQRRLLRAHAASWRRHFARRLALAAAFAHVAMRPAAAAALWPLVRAWPAVLTHGARWSGKTRSAADAATIMAQLAPMA